MTGQRALLARQAPAARTAAPATLQRSCACEETGESCSRCAAKRAPLQRLAGPGAPPHGLPGAVGEVLRASGQPLPPATRARMEERFGCDFSGVRIHADAAARNSSAVVNARAYTVGSHIVLGRGAPDFASREGRRLLGHELAHVVQQSRGGVAGGIDPDPALETDAHRAGDAVAADRPAQVAHSAGPMLAREPTLDAPHVDSFATTMRNVVYEVTFPEGKKRFTKEEYEAAKVHAANRLRIDLNRVIGYAQNGRASQTDMLREYQGGVESLGDVFRKPKALIGIAADIWGQTSPPWIGMWDHPKNAASNGLKALERGDLREAARLLSLADTQYRDAMHEWNAYREKTIGGGESLASDLETVRDVSFAIALAAGAAIAAPVIAGGVASAGVTGVGATALTAGGTALVTGAGGVALGGGSTAVASYAAEGKVDRKAVARDAAKFGKLGAVTGLTAGLGEALAGAGAAAKLGRPLLQQAARRCLTEAGVNVTGEITTEALDKLFPPAPQPEQTAADTKELVGAKTRALAIGCISGVLGVPASKLKSGTATVADKTIGAGTAFADAKLQGMSNKDAAIAAAQSTASSHLVGAGKKGTDAAAAKRAETAPKPTAAVAPHETVEPPAKPAPKPAPEKAPEAAKKAAPAHVEEKPAMKPPEPAPAPEKTIDPAKATAHTDAANGHEAVVTPGGVGVCSPRPCPVIHLEYAKELAAAPELKAWNDRIQAMRRRSPEAAAKSAADLIRELEARRAAPKGRAKAGASKSADAPKPPANETSFEGLIDPREFGNDPRIIDRLSRAREHDIGGYHSLTGKGEFGRTGDRLDSDEALQNAYIRMKKGVGRTSAATRDNPAIALSPEKHRLVNNLKQAQMAGLDPHQVLDHHLRQLKDHVPDFVLETLRKEGEAFIARTFGGTTP